MALSANLNLMIKAARVAGRALLKDFQEVENLQASMKGPVDFVNKAELTAQEALKTDLLAARPTYGWTTSDGGNIEGKDPTRRWIVDSLNGTNNFLHGIPHFAVSIALEHKGEIVAGTIYDPSKDELFLAEKGQGAFVNEARLRVSSRRRMSDSIFATGLPAGGNPGLPGALREIALVTPAVAGVRQWGSPSLDIAYVAAGRFEGYWERGLQPWDVAAGVVILQEAGGFAEPIRAGGNIVEDGTVIAANDPIFPQLTKLVRPA